MSSKQIPSRRNILGLGAGASLGLLGACSRSDGTSASPAVTSNPGQATGASVAVPASSAPGSAEASPTQTPTPSSTPSGDANFVDPLPAGRPVNVLIFGTDSRTPGSYLGNSDVLVFLQLSADRKRVSLVSLPRDLWLKMPPRSDGKINWSLERGGIELLKSNVSGLVGVPLDYTLQTNFVGFIGLATIMDGFIVNNPIASTAQPDGTFVTQPIPCPAGPLELHKNQWLAFVRQRKEFPLGDLDRTRRHRATVIGMGKWVQKKVASNAAFMSTLVPQALQNMQVTGGLTAAQLSKLGGVLLQIDPAQTISLMYPVAKFDKVNGQGIDVIDQGRAAAMQEGIKSGDLRPYVAKYGTSNALTGG